MNRSDPKLFRRPEASSDVEDGEALDRVFIYGSLRRGQRYRYLIAPYVVKERSARIDGRMYHFASPGETGPYPYVVPGDGVVLGDVVWLRDRTCALHVLDRLEDHPQLYERRIAPVTYEDGSVDSAYVYFLAALPTVHGVPVPDGDWVAELDRS